MDKRDKQIVISLLILVLVVFLVGIFINKINSKKDPISFTPSQSRENLDDVKNEELDEDKIDDELNEKDAQVSEENKDSTGSTLTEEIMYATETLNVRSGAGVEYDLIDSVSQGETVIVIEKGSNGWYKILLNESEVYVLGTYLTSTMP